MEYPAALPGLKCEPPRGTRAERGVVASDFFSRELGPGRILAINGLHFVPVAVEKSHLVAARVAGFDSAAFGLPKQTYPLLYTTNFAWLGLHEAAAAGDQQAAEAEAKLAAFLCRIQVRSETQPALDGGWFRAFDFRRWEPWGSNADAGWGAWAIESGWTQGWITSVFGMRQMKTSLWDLTAETRIARHFDRLRREMLPDAALAANFLRAHRVGIFLPKRVEFSVSDDGRTFQPIGQVEPAAPARDMTPQTVRLTVTVQKTVTRFVRLQAENFGPLPSWVIAGSVPAWLFAGEFLVNYKPATGCTPDKGTQQTDMEITDP